MRDKTVFHLIADLSKQKKVRCILIGGFAVNYYKVTRQTADVDFLITEEDFKKILPLLGKQGYREDFIERVFVRLTSSKPELMDLDFMFIDKETLDKIIKDAEEISIAGQKLFVPSLNNLIALKLHSIKYNFKIREYKDIPDIINLIKINKIDTESQKFRELCLKYGTEEIYNKILSAL